MCELLAALETPTYIERVALNDMKNVMKAKRAVKKALEIQKNGGGFSLVEILSPCPTIMKMDPVVARKWVGEALVKAFPLGVFRDHKPDLPPNAKVPHKTVAEALEVDESTPAIPETRRHHHTRELTVKIAGFGGQGILLMGQLLAEMGLREHMEVSWLPSYGPEMRSGSAHCHVTLAHERIGTPLISQPEVLIAMNELSLRKFASSVVSGGLVLYNHSKLPDDFQVSQAQGGVRTCIGDSRQDRLGEGGQRGHARRAAGRNRVPAHRVSDFGARSNREEPRACSSWTSWRSLPAAATLIPKLRLARSASRTDIRTERWLGELQAQGRPVVG